MNLDDLSIDELAALHGALGIIQGAAETLACLRPDAVNAVRISLQPGELVTVTAPWSMPACGCCYADGIDFVIEDVPGDAPASGNPGGSGDLQQVHNAESPPPAPPGSAMETGESPEVAPVATAPSAGVVPPAPVEEPVAAPAPDRPDSWTAEDDRRVVAIVTGLMLGGTSRHAACNAAVQHFPTRTGAAINARLRQKLRPKFEAAMAAGLNAIPDAGQPAPADPAPNAAVLDQPAPREPVQRAQPPIPEAPPANEAAGSDAPRGTAPVAGGAAPDLTPRQREILAGLAHVPKMAGFDAELDLEIVEAFASGSKTAEIALDFSIEPARLLTRHRELTAMIRNQRDPRVIPIEGQADLLVVLRHLVREARGVAA